MNSLSRGTLCDPLVRNNPMGLISSNVTASSLNLEAEVAQDVLHLPSRAVKS